MYLSCAFKKPISANDCKLSRYDTNSVVKEKVGIVMEELLIMGFF